MKKNNAFVCCVMLSFPHIAEKVDHVVRTVDSHQHNLIAEKDLQSHEHQDLAGAADHLVPNPKNNQR